MKHFLKISSLFLVLLFSSCTKDDIYVESVSLNANELALSINETSVLVATITPDNATNKSVTWSSADEETATVDNTGKVTAVKEGETTITVTTEDGGKKAVCKVTVAAETIAVTGVSLDKNEISVKVGETESLTATITPDNATNKSVTWSSADEETATVDNTGKVTAVKEGETTITVTTEDGGKKAVCKVTVISQEPETPDYIDEYGINHGKGIAITGSDGIELIWAPVNCGYHATDYTLGKLYQWGRIYGQGFGEPDANYPDKEWTFIQGPVSPEEGNSEGNKDSFIVGEAGDWANPPLNEWNEEYVPCPEGWRIPTHEEFTALLGGQTNAPLVEVDGVKGCYFNGTPEGGEGLFLPAAGGRSFLSGASGREKKGSYWTCTTYQYLSIFLNFNAANSEMAMCDRGNGHSIRCVAE